MKLNPLVLNSVQAKIAAVSALELADLGSHWEIPSIPLRDLEIRSPEDMPKRVGFSLPEGRARLLHDLGNIELQAIELCLRTLIEYPEAPLQFREELFELMQSERSHLELCLAGLEELKFKWGHWPVHVGLWASVSKDDELLDRILIVHRYLEGSGLDAGSNLIKRLKGVPPESVHRIVEQITREEVGHVKFGSDWYRELCSRQGLDPETDFPVRFQNIEKQVPKRIDKLNRELRKKAGFTDRELDFLESKVSEWSLF
jgi:uncharacterized ferritin-like protein (DUF455 family)